ncbi:hypothetical protein ACS0TY_032109 [Phlomoides rotata]
MAPQSESILFTFLSVLVLALPILGAAVGRSPLVGGWRPIADPNAPEVVKIAKFAVDQHNKEAKTSLVFEKVVKGEQQVVAGVNYRLVISAAEGGATAPKTYKAVVYSRSWDNYQKLLSFEVFDG